jgi:hypothetical protein
MIADRMEYGPVQCTPPEIPDVFRSDGNGFGAFGDLFDEVLAANPPADVITRYECEV